MNPPDRLNRTLLTLLALVLVALGGAGLAAAVGAFGSSFSHRAVFDNAVCRYVGHHGGWLWPLIAVGSILIAVAALRWLATQASTERVGSIAIRSEAGRGTTTLRSSAITDAVATHVETYRGVRAAHARLRGEGGEERLALRVVVADRVDFAELRAKIETRAVADARSALDDSTFPITVAYDVTTKAPPRDL